MKYSLPQKIRVYFIITPVFISFHITYYLMRFTFTTRILFTKAFLQKFKRLIQLMQPVRMAYNYFYMWKYNQSTTAPFIVCIQMAFQILRLFSGASKNKVTFLKVRPFFIQDAKQRNRLHCFGPPQLNKLNLTLHAPSLM